MTQLQSNPGCAGPDGADAARSLESEVPEDAIAIVGLALRFPGDLADEDAFWQALLRGADLVTQVPAERWATQEMLHPRRSEPGRSITFAAGVLSDVEGFDAAFFGISPREAATLDPQQRLMLELAWEALENGGQRPSRLAGSDTAVFVGVSSLDNGMRGLDDLATLSAHAMTGNTLSIVANRISYVLDLRGPSLALDSACSSSLVAVHQACTLLRSGEASAAFAGGVNLLLHPYSFIGFTKASMLAAGGRCRAFDAAGDGYVRAEGGAMLFLKRARDAIAAGDPIQALILASATNTDGARKTGLTIPSGAAQAELMQQVLDRSGVAAAEVDFIEAHGTGTPVGDPIEAAAIGAVYGRGREAPLPVGSVKSNLGHLEPVSGLAGLAKAVLALRHRALPASLHLDQPNPHIDFAALNLTVPTRTLPLRAARTPPLRAGVNSFGFGGANAHVLLQEPPPPRYAPPPPEAPVLTLSARSEPALRELAARYATRLGVADARTAYDLAHAAATRRDRLPHRLALTIDSPLAAAEALGRFSRHEPAATVVREDALPEPGGIAFVYAGNGAQWFGMGRRLWDESARFRAALESLEPLVLTHCGLSLGAELLATAEASRLDDTRVAQPLLFALQVALTGWLRAAGIVPVAVLGHSVGEVAAAWAAGMLDLEQAVRVVGARSAAQSTTRGSGRMAALALDETQARTWLQQLAERIGRALDVEIAAINAPGRLTLSGALPDLETIGDHARARGVLFQLLELDYAFHSRHMEPVRETLMGRLEGLCPSPGTLAYVSSVTGAQTEGSQLDASYWWRNLREPVRFAEAIATLARRGCRVFVEIGPQPILQRYLGESLAAVGARGRVLATLRRDDDGEQPLRELALRLPLLAEDPGPGPGFARPGRALRLPNYPWQRERHLAALSPEAHALIQRRRVHPLLGWRLTEVEFGWENTLDAEVLPWLGEHRVAEAVVFPGAGFVELALAAVRAWRSDASIALEQVAILAPLVFESGQSRTLRVYLDAQDGGIRILSRPRLSSLEWTVHATARALDPPRPGRAALDPPDADAVLLEGSEHYRLARAVGLEYGASFQGVRRARVGARLLEIDIDLPAALRQASGYLLHPALLDLCFQSCVDFFHAELAAGRGSLYLPVQMQRVDLYRKTPVATLRAQLQRHTPRSLLVDVEMLDAAGALVARIQGARSRRVPGARPARSGASAWRCVPRLRPHPLEQQSAAAPGPAELARLWDEAFADAATADSRRAWHERQLPLFEALTLAMLRDAMSQVLQRDAAHAHARLDGGEGPAFWRWAVRLLRQEGLLRKEQAAWQVVRDEELPAATVLWRELWQEAPESAPQLALMARIAGELPGLLAGVSAASGWQDAAWQSPLAEARVARDPAYQGTHRALSRLLRSLLGQWPQARRLRVLELGRDTSLAEALRDLAAPDRLEYVLAPGDGLAQARVPGDASNGPAPPSSGGQGIDPSAQWRSRHARFDLVLLHHELHRAEDPDSLLREVHQVLVPGGLLLLAERHPDWHCDLMEGLAPRWWREGADGEPVSSLRAPAGWADRLEQLFEDVVTCTEPAAAAWHAGAYLLMARRPAAGRPMWPEVAAAHWCLLADDASAGFAQALADQLRSQSQSVDVCLAPAAADAGAAHQVFLRHWACPPELAATACADLLDCLRGRAAQAPGARLWLLTRGGALADVVDADDPVQAALWGLARVAMNEYPQLACGLVELGRGDLVEVPDTLLRELLFPDGGDEIVLDPAGRRHLVWEPAAPVVPAADAATRDCRLDFSAPGQLRHLHWQPMAVAPPGPREVEVEPRAVGLNFRDVMYAMGLLPDEAVEAGFAGATLGLEFAGVVARVGAQVTDLAPGDAVVGFGPACLATRVTTRREAITALPPGWSFEAAATVPTAFLTAWYALSRLAQLQPGERVLIHGAAGGVGLAAIQVARHLGAEILATAGSPDKRELVRWLGAGHVFDSRGLDFADEVLAATGGQGVDVVLNSLAGEAVRRSLSLLRPFGRFLELGKRDFFENTRVALRPLRDNIAYHGIDADRLLLERPALAAHLFDEVMQRLRDGRFRPLPRRLYPADGVVEAFRTLQQARHVGKVVVSLAQPPSRIEVEASAPPVSLPSDGTWLVSGGLGGFGLATAAWLADRGARHLVLLGRRGLATPGASAAVEALQARGVKVWAQACDVTDRAALSELLVRVRAQLPPLRGVLHAAMAIDDGLLADLDVTRLDTALRPKLLGAWHLHELTASDRLQYFVLYSSITAWLGSPGQGNYVAANAALEALARHRRRRGLPATCIAWGPIEDAGFLARNEGVKDGTRRRMGAAALASHEALESLEAALREDDSGQCVASFDWAVLARLLPAAQRPRFGWLNAMPGSAQAATGDDFRARIQGKPEVEVFELVRALVREEAARILCLAVERIELQRSLHEAGMDSLMAVELAFALEQRVGLQLPLMSLNEGPSVDRIARRITDGLLGAGEAAATATPALAEVVGELARQHGESVTQAELDRVQRAVEPAATERQDA